MKTTGTENTPNPVLPNNLPKELQNKKEEKIKAKKNNSNNNNKEEVSTMNKNVDLKEKKVLKETKKVENKTNEKVIEKKEEVKPKRTENANTNATEEKKKEVKAKSTETVEKKELKKVDIKKENDNKNDNEMKPAKIVSKIN